MKTSDLFVRCLENEGVKYIFGVPGEENLDLLESIRNSDIRFILTRHEQAAGFMAATYGRLTGEPGVCLTTLGPGATNVFTATAHAFLGGFPTFFITGQKPIRKSEQGRFQIIDTVEMMEPVTKFSKQIVDGDTVPALIRDGFRIAKREKPGPVHLELPEDIASLSTDRSPFEVVDTSPPSANDDAIAKAAEMIERADRPLVLIASGANRYRAHQALADFIEETGIFFFTTQMGKGVVDERHKRCLGTAALSDHDYLHDAIKKSDLIINIGHDVSEKPPFLMKKGGTPVIHIGYSPAQIDDIYFPQHEVIGCLETNLRLLCDALPSSKDWTCKQFAAAKESIDHRVFGDSQESKFPNIPQRIVSDVREALPDHGIISLDNGMYKIWFARNFQAYCPNSLLLDNTLASMGAGLPVAMAAKLIRPEAQVLAICGDGGFMMNSQELETAVRLKLDLVILILRDDAYGMIKWKQNDMDFDDFALDFGNPDFKLYAESYGASGHTVRKTGELVPLVKKCFSQGGVHLIETPIDYSENKKVLSEELKDRIVGT